MENVVAMYGLSVRATNTLVKLEADMGTENSARASARILWIDGSLYRCRQCGRKTQREIYAWLNADPGNHGMTCKSCVYWECLKPADEDSGGLCRRNAPHPVIRPKSLDFRNIDDPNLVYFPFIHHNEWCGQWKASKSIYSP
ncbi:MAG: hypothetical protein WCK89_06960 [bacterium]